MNDSTSSVPSGLCGCGCGGRPSYPGSRFLPGHHEKLPKQLPDFGVNRNRGFCHCGCGQLAPVTLKSNTQRGWIKGERKKYLNGHNGRLRSSPPQLVSPEAFRLWWDTFAPVQFGKCWCGCGQDSPLAKSTDRRWGLLKGQPAKYVKTHNRHSNTPEYEVQDLGYNSPCWIWQRYTDAHGYGFTRANGRTGQLAHRVYYERLIAPIPNGFELHHLCVEAGAGSSSCVNPNHLEPVKRAENMQRSRKATLTKEDVEYIRGAYPSTGSAYLADFFGVHVTAIQNVIAYRTWKSEG